MVREPGDLRGDEEPTLDTLLQRRTSLAEDQARAFETVSKVRSGALTTAAVIFLAILLLERFLYLAQREQLLLSLLPALVMAGAGTLDLLLYAPRLLEQRAGVRALEEAIARRGGEQLAGPEPSAHTRTRGVLWAYYLGTVAALLALALARVS